MTVRSLYSALDLRGLPLRGLGAPVADSDAVTRGYLELRLAALQSQVDVLQGQLNRLVAERRDPLVVGPTDPGFVRGVWVQTGVGPDGNGMTMWVRDGSG